MPVMRYLCIVCNTRLHLLWIYKMQKKDHVVVQDSMLTNSCSACEVLGFVFWQWDRNDTQEEIQVPVTNSFSQSRDPA